MFKINHFKNNFYVSIFRPWNDKIWLEGMTDEIEYGIFTIDLAVLKGSNLKSGNSFSYLCSY